MTIKQLSIFIENKGGTLIQVLDLFSKAGIQLIASTIADTKDYGIYRVVCNVPGQAFALLRQHGINVQLTDVVALSIDDIPGRAAQAVRLFSDAGVDIQYMYSFLWQGRGVLVMRTSPDELARRVITDNRMPVLTEQDFSKP